MTKDLIRDALWTRVYADALQRKVVWWEARDAANDAVLRYDKRPAVDPSTTQTPKTCTDCQAIFKHEPSCPKFGEPL